VETAWSRWAVENGIVAEPLLRRIHGRPSRDVLLEFAPHLDVQVEALRLIGYQAEAGAVCAYPGALECLEFVGGSAWAIVTSGERELALGRLRAAGLPEPLVLISAEDVTRGKPDPEPYLVGAARLGLAASDCVVVEDAPAGVRAGRAAGMTVCAVATTHLRSALSEADRICADLFALMRWLRGGAVIRRDDRRVPRQRL
jgi:sugar-phosphatase